MDYFGKLNGIRQQCLENMERLRQHYLYVVMVATSITFRDVIKFLIKEVYCKFR